ncbi:MAG: hypothetical protein AAB701_00050, partial [Patescibacteria group bacterium]
TTRTQQTTPAPQPNTQTPVVVAQAMEGHTPATLSDKTVNKLSRLLVAILLLLIFNVILLIWVLFVNLRGPRNVQRF